MGIRSGKLLNRCNQSHPGVVDHHVDIAQLGQGLRGPLKNGVIIAGGRYPGMRIATLGAQCGVHPLQPGCINVGQHQAGALCRHAFCQCFTNARGSSGDDHNCSLKAAHSG